MHLLLPMSHYMCIYISINLCTQLEPFNLWGRDNSQTVYYSISYEKLDNDDKEMFHCTYCKPEVTFYYGFISIYMYDVYTWVNDACNVVAMVVCYLIIYHTNWFMLQVISLLLLCGKSICIANSCSVFP